jgi:hypothetical protein
MQGRLEEELKIKEIKDVLLNILNEMTFLQDTFIERSTRIYKDIRLISVLISDDQDKDIKPKENVIKFHD